MLNQLVNVHTQELRAKGLSLSSLPLSDRNRGRPREDRSETSSTASRESWATFASNSVAFITYSKLEKAYWAIASIYCGASTEDEKHLFELV